MARRSKNATPEPEAFADQLEAAKNDSVGQLLIRAARLWNELALAELETATGYQMRPALMAVFPHIDLEGTRPSVLADKLGVSRQAVHPLIDELEEMGVIERIADPADGRAILVRFSKRGQAAILDGIGLLKRMEGELQEIIGERAMRGLGRGLRFLVPVLEARVASKNDS